jgi:hypothetical protein
MDAGKGQGSLFSSALLRDSIRWSIWVGLAVAVAGGFITRDWRFALACVLGAAVDIASVYWIARRTEAAGDVATATSSLSVMFVAGRVVLKAVVLVAAFALPSVLSFWGALCGVLVFDATLVCVGAVKGVRQPSSPFGARHS